VAEGVKVAAAEGVKGGTATLKRRSDQAPDRWRRLV